MTDTPETTDTLTIAWVQHCRAPEMEAAEHLHRVEQWVREAATQGAAYVVLPELFQHVYFPQTQDPKHFDWAEPMDGPVVQRMQALARELGAAISVPFFEQRAPGIFHNSLVTIGADGQLLPGGVYRKNHIPHDPGFEEKYYFTPADAEQGAPVFEVGGFRAAAMICWDQWFPELARLATLGGAELLVYPTAIGWDDSEPPELGAKQLDAWKTMHRAHAIANGVYVLAVNRVGREGALTFWGHSLLVDPFGEVIAEADETFEGVMTATISRNEIEQTRRAWPFLRDRRVDLYGQLTQRWIDAPGSTPGSTSA